MKTILDVLKNLNLKESEEESESTADAINDIKLTKHTDYPDKVKGFFVGLATVHSVSTTNVIVDFSEKFVNNLPYPFRILRKATSSSTRILFLNTDDAEKYKSTFNLTQDTINNRNLIEAVRIDINGDIPCYAAVDYVKDVLKSDPDSIHPIIKERLKSEASPNSMSGSNSQKSDKIDNTLKNLKEIEKQVLELGGEIVSTSEYSIPLTSIYDKSLNYPNDDFFMKYVKNLILHVNSTSVSINIDRRSINTTFDDMKLSEKAAENLKSLLDMYTKQSSNFYQTLMKKAIINKFLTTFDGKPNKDLLHGIAIWSYKHDNSLHQNYLYNGKNFNIIRFDIKFFIDKHIDLEWYFVSSNIIKINIGKSIDWTKDSLLNVCRKALRAFMIDIDIKETIQDTNKALENCDDIIENLTSTSYIKVSEI